MPKRRQRLRLWLWAGLILSIFYAAHELPVGQRFNLAMAPVLNALHKPGQWWQEMQLWFHERSSLQAQYAAAMQQLEQQAAMVQELNSLREENLQLRSLLDIKSLAGYRWHAAKVRGRSPDKMSQRLVLQVENAFSDDVIVSSEGLVGLVDRATRDHAVVRTILDASLAVPVTIKGQKLAALMRGQGNRIEVDFVPIHNAPAVGSILQTSGAGGLFPPGIPAARIMEISPMPGQVFAHVTAEPVAHWQRDNWLAVASRWQKGKRP